MIQTDKSVIVQNSRQTWMTVRKMAGLTLSLVSQVGFGELGQGVSKYPRTLRGVL